jgi:hypothetical protein
MMDVGGVDADDQAKQYLYLIGQWPAVPDLVNLT